MPSAVDDFALGGTGVEALLPEIGVDEGGVVAVGDEADFLAVGLAGDGDAEAFGEIAHFGLRHRAEREEGAGELVLREAEEEIGLVLAVIDATAHLPAAAGGVEGDAGVVAGGDALGADAVGHVEKLVELDEVVAEGAGDGRAAGEVLVDEGLDDLALEALFEVDDVVGNAELLGDAAGVVDVVERAAASGCAALGNEIGQAALVPQLHGQADDAAALAVQQTGDGGAVDAAGHGDGDDAGVIAVHGRCKWARGGADGWPSRRRRR